LKFERRSIASIAATRARGHNQSYGDPSNLPSSDSFVVPADWVQCRPAERVVRQDVRGFVKKENRDESLDQRISAEQQRTES